MRAPSWAAAWSGGGDGGAVSAAMAENRASIQAPGQRVGYTGQGHHIGGAGEQEAAGPTPIIHRQLDRQAQFGDPLHLIDHGPIKATDEALRILAGGGAGGGVVEGEVGALLAGELPHQGGLAALVGPIEQHHRGNGQALQQAPDDAAGPGRLREHESAAADPESGAVQLGI